MKEKIWKLLNSPNSEDIEVAKMLLEIKFPVYYYKSIGTVAYNREENEYFLFIGHLGKALKLTDTWDYFSGGTVSVEKEDYLNLKQKVEKIMMMYKATKHKNIYRVGNRYRVRKHVNGERISALFTTLKDCQKWLNLMSK